MSDQHTSAWNLLRGESPWAMSPEHLGAFAARISAAPDRKLASRRAPMAPTTTSVIPIVGPLVRRTSILGEMFGLASYESIRAQVAQALGDPRVDRLLCFVDSPGGAAMGCEELHLDIANAAKQKPVIVYVAGECCSAALWSIAGANEIISTVSGSIGSVGVWSLHVDASVALDKAGLKPTFIVSGVSPYKVECNETAPLEKSALAYEQKQVDMIAGKFVSGLAIGRGVSEAHVISKFGQGRVMFSEDGKRVGLLDRIGNLDLALRSRPVIGGRSAQARRAQLAELKKPVTEHGALIAARTRRLQLLRAT